MKDRKKVSGVKSNLFEAIKTSEIVKNNPKKYRIAKKLIAISENKFIKERNRLKEKHGPEDESEMAMAQLAAIIEKSNELLRMMEGVNQLEDWLQYKLSIAENYIDAIHGYIKYFNGENDMGDDKMEDDETFDDVDEEDFDDEQMDYYDDEEDFEEIDNFDGDGFEDEYEDFDDDDDEFIV